MFTQLIAAIAIVGAVAQSAELPEVKALAQTREALETSVRQVKGKQGGDPAKLAALEKQYAALVANFEKWRSAAATPTSGRGAADAMAGALAREMATFGSHARSFNSGVPGTVVGSTVSRFEKQLKDAARVLSRAEGGAAQSPTGLAWQSWAEIR